MVHKLLTAQSDDDMLSWPGAFHGNTAKLLAKDGPDDLKAWRCDTARENFFTIYCGYADGDRMPPRVLARQAQDIVCSVAVPVTVDVEAGYSDDATTVMRHLGPIFDAGVAGLNIEDGRDPPPVLARKVEAIKGWIAHRGLDVFINVRTDV